MGHRTYIGGDIRNLVSDTEKGVRVKECCRAQDRGGKVLGAKEDGLQKDDGVKGRGVAEEGLTY